jgi:hypothetical protein
MAFTEAMAGSLVLQVPPAIDSVKVSVTPAHKVVTPVMKPGDGIVLMVTAVVLNAVPQVPATV